MDDSSSEKTKVQEYGSHPVSRTGSPKGSKPEGWVSPDVETTSVRSVDPDDIYPEGGWGWLVVLGCFIYASITIGWGFIFLVLQAWGVFQSYYKENILQGTSDTLLSTLGSVPCLIMTFFSIIAGKWGDRYGYKPFFVIGGFMWVMGQVGTASSTKLWHFFVTQGIFQGIAAAFVFPLILALPAQWFLKRRAFATGIVVAGSSMGGAVGALMLRAMLTSLGLKKTMIVFACIDAAMLTIATLLIKERKTPRRQEKKIVWLDRSFLVDPVFWSLGISLFLCVMGYLPPIFFLPTFAKDKIPGISDIMTTVPVTVLNFSAAVGRATIGFIADRMGPVNALFFVTIMSGLSQLLIWAFINNYAGIMGFAVLYGFFCGSFLSLTPAVAAHLYGADRLAGLSGLLLLFNVPGNGAGAPLTGAVLRATNNNWQVAAGMNGGMQVAAAIILLYARFKREQKITAAY